MKFATSVLAAEAAAAAVIALVLVVLKRANGRMRRAAVAVAVLTSDGENDATVEALGNVNVRSAWERKALATTRIVIDDDVGH